jgi:hypothetical protein
MVIQRAAGMSEEEIEQWKERIESGLSLEVKQPVDDSAVEEPANSFGCDKPRRPLQKPAPTAEESFTSAPDPELVESLLDESEELLSSEVESEQSELSGVSEVESEVSSDASGDDPLDDFLDQFHK